jgi:hypothetical protein
VATKDFADPDADHRTSAPIGAHVQTNHLIHRPVAHCNVPSGPISEIGKLVGDHCPLEIHLGNHPNPRP